MLSPLALHRDTVRRCDIDAICTCMVSCQVADLDPSSEQINDDNTGFRATKEVVTRLKALSLLNSRNHFWHCRPHLGISASPFADSKTTVGHFFGWVDWKKAKARIAIEFVLHAADAGLEWLFCQILKLWSFVLKSTWQQHCAEQSVACSSAALVLQHPKSRFAESNPVKRDSQSGTTKRKLHSPSLASSANNTGSMLKLC